MSQDRPASGSPQGVSAWIESLEGLLVRSPMRCGIWLFAGAFAIRLAFLAQYANCPFFFSPSLDQLHHHLLAQAWSRGEIPGEPFLRAPLYDIFLATIYRYLGDGLWPSRLVQAVMGAGSCVLLARLGARTHDLVTGFLAGCVMALYGPLVFYDGELLSAVLEVFCVLVALWATVRADGCEKGGSWGFAGLTLGLAAIARPNVLVFACPVALWILARDRMQGIGGVVLFATSTAVFPGIVTAFNVVVGEDRVFIASQGGINLYLGNRDRADGFTISTPKRFDTEGPYQDSVEVFARREAEARLGRELKPSEISRYWAGQAVEWWWDHPSEALALTARRFVLLFNRQEIRNNHGFDFVAREFAPVLAWCPFGFGLVGWMGLVGLVLAFIDLGRGESRPPAILALFVLAFMGSYMLFFAGDRYRLPAVGPLILLGTGFCVSLPRRWQRARPPRRLALGLGVIAAGIFVNVGWIQTHRPTDEAKDWWVAGNGYTAVGQFEAARAAYHRALELDGSDARTWNNLGRALFLAGRLEPAARAFARAIQADPSYADPYYNLAVLDLGRGRKMGRQALEAAVRIDPDHRLRPHAESLLENSGAGAGSMPEGS